MTDSNYCNTMHVNRAGLIDPFEFYVHDVVEPTLTLDNIHLKIKILDVREDFKPQSEKHVEKNVSEDYNDRKTHVFYENSQLRLRTQRTQFTKHLPATTHRKQCYIEGKRKIIKTFK